MESDSLTELEVVSATQEKDDIQPPDKHQIIYPDTNNPKRTIWKNVVIISLGYMLLFTSMNSLESLQSTINKENGLGTAGLSVLYGGMILSSLFLQNLVLHYLGYKWTIPFCMLFYIIYMCANLYPTWWTIIPSAALVGLLGAPFWTCRSVYITEAGVWYASVCNRDKDATVSQFFSIFYTIFQTSSIFGNIISSVVLVQEDPPYNATNTSGSNKDYGLCGANYCPWFNDTKTSLRPVEDVQRYIMCGIYISIAVVGVVAVSVFLDRIAAGSKNENEKEQVSTKSHILSTMRHWRHLSQLLLVPITVFNGTIAAFVFGEVNRSYVGCIMGVQYVGYTMLCYGVCSAVGSILIAVLSKKVGRIYIMVVSLVLQLGSCILLLRWRPMGLEHEYYILLLIYGGYALSEMALKTQTLAVYGSFFPLKKDAAFANYKLFQSLGVTIAFAYSDALCTDVKLYIVVGLLVLSLLTYLLAEVRQRRKEKAEI